MIRAMLIDDEEPARDRLRAMLGSFDDVEIVGEAGDGEEALQQISLHRPDVVFLDIQMPGRSGMEVAAALEPPRPHIIFCTAFDQHALDAFELHALDYLLKPLNRTRLAGAVDRVRSSQEEQRRMRRQLADASRTQERLLPQLRPAMSHLDYDGSCRTALGVGGDYYDFIDLGQDRLGLAVADVSGKGIYAGLLMAGLQARMQSLALNSDGPLDRVMSELNRGLHASTQDNHYATCFYGVFDDQTKRLNYVNAGHNPPLLWRSAEQRWERLGANGTVLGLLDRATYSEESVELETGDLLLIYTDGLTESVNRDGEEFGEQRLKGAVEPGESLSADALRDQLLGAVDRFRGEVPLPDDLTLVVARVTG